jgi:adenylate cyclase, class 2
MNDQEIETKFYISNPEKLISTLKDSGANCIQPRTLEINLRYDTSDLSLSKAGKALRIRYDTETRMTYKGPTTIDGGAQIRQEIEFSASDFITAQHFLAALGYQVILIYEKFRTTYRLHDCMITCDELPYGHFVEIEGPDLDHLRMVADYLSLNADASIGKSYSVLFDNLRIKLGLEFRDLIFDNFVNLKITYSDLSVIPADVINLGD